MADIVGRVGKIKSISIPKQSEEAKRKRQIEGITITLQVVRGDKE